MAAGDCGCDVHRDGKWYRSLLLCSSGSAGNYERNVFGDTKYGQPCAPHMAIYDIYIYYDMQLYKSWRANSALFWQMVIEEVSQDKQIIQDSDL